MNEKASSNNVNPTTTNDWEAYWQYFETNGRINYTPELLETVRKHIALQGARILEVGSGTGGNASELATQGATVTTLDFAPTALQRTVQTGRKAGVDLEPVQADARSLPFATKSFDLVYHQGFLEHFMDPEVFVCEQHRILRDGGYLLVDVPQRYNWYTVYKHRLIRQGRWPYGGWESEFSVRQLVRLLRDNGFKYVTAYGRGYYPRPFSMLRNAGKLEQILLRRHTRQLSIFQQWYDAGWHRFERGWLGRNTLQCIGVLAQAEVAR